MKDEKSLLQEVLADDKLSALRSASLERALVEMRRRRQRRRVGRALALVLIPLGLMVAFVGPYLARKSKTAQAVSSIVQHEPAPSQPSSVESISDEELFALFPNRALALIGTPGQQQLVFLDVRGHN